MLKHSIGAAVSTILRKVSILKDLTDSELAEVWNICRLAEFESGSIIMREGESGDSMYFFVEGTVDVSKSMTLKLDSGSNSKVEKSMVILKAPAVAIFGEMAMLEEEPRSATITALSHCVLYELDRNDFTELCDSRPELGLKLLRGIAGIMSGRIRKTNEDKLKLSTALNLALSKQSGA